MIERRHQQGWMWKVIFVSVLSGVVGYLLPLLLTESPDQRRAALVATQTVLLQRDHTIRQKFAGLKTDLNAYEVAVGDIWKVSALRKLRDDHVLRESHEHLDAIKTSMLERRAAMVSLLADTTRSIHDAISTLREHSAYPSSEHCTEHNVLVEEGTKPPLDDTITLLDLPPTTPTSSPPEASSAHNNVLPPPSSVTPPTPPVSHTPPSHHVKPPTMPQPVPSPAPTPPSPRQFPITFGQAAMAFFTALVTLVAFSLVSEHHRRGAGGDGDYSMIQGFFSPRQKQRPRPPSNDATSSPRTRARRHRNDEQPRATANVDEFIAESGSYYDMQYPQEGSTLTEATPVRRSRRLDAAAHMSSTYF
ncbi:hypothetical protein H257_14993 [Aphanomyces astaci]|uniref:Transmembrane protein n=1 Tax=Aphanomyces astaci TaxID=112090 RepID=W4FRW9_APHAT|nr:hypothetical protein H257_14993 [Aphanomyces astaci]ETV69403.1 hypothetical protein H257_14993 [Aphanomyces astaci]|eukprot:XP_009841260.1 hypothetical protein H257_14993 [Aphanomyces astaci]